MNEEDCDTVVYGAETPCRHSKGAHHADGCMWCDCGEYT